MTGDCKPNVAPVEVERWIMNVSVGHFINEPGGNYTAAKQVSVH